MEAVVTLSATRHLSFRMRLYSRLCFAYEEAGMILSAAKTALHAQAEVRKLRNLEELQPPLPETVARTLQQAERDTTILLLKYTYALSTEESLLSEEEMESASQEAAGLQQARIESSRDESGDETEKTDLEERELRAQLSLIRELCIGRKVVDRVRKWGVGKYRLRTRQAQWSALIECVADRGASHRPFKGAKLLAPPSAGAAASELQGDDWLGEGERSGDDERTLRQRRLVWACVVLLDPSVERPVEEEEKKEGEEDQQQISYDPLSIQAGELIVLLHELVYLKEWRRLTVVLGWIHAWLENPATEQPSCGVNLEFRAVEAVPDGGPEEVSQAFEEHTERVNRQIFEDQLSFIEHFVQAICWSAYQVLNAIGARAGRSRAPHPPMKFLV